MKQLVILFCVTIFIACNNSSQSKSPLQSFQEAKSAHIQLIDSLGTIDILIPSRYDTNFSWVHYSDCGKACNQENYRFQSKVFPIIKESGWMYFKPKDSIDWFTISHSMDFPFHEGDTSKNLAMHNLLKSQILAESKSMSINFDTIQRINDRYFSIFEMDKTDSFQTKKVVAVTTIKSNLITFQYELISKKRDSISENFLKNSYNFLNSIRISKGI